MVSVISILLAVVLASFVWWSVSKNVDDMPVSVIAEKISSSTTDSIKKAEIAKQQMETRSSVKADFSGQGLSALPAGIFGWTQLEELNLSHNSFGGSLQAEVRMLSKLKVLNLSNNSFTGVPAEVGQLQSLEVLDLSNNILTGLPHEIGNLSRLQTLNLSGNNYNKEDLAKIRESLSSSTKVIID